MDANRLGQVLCFATAVLLGGCDSYYRHHVPMDPAFGNATRHNRAAHAVDLDPAWAKDTDLLIEGKRVQKATDRYHGGAEKQPEAVVTK